MYVTKSYKCKELRIGVPDVGIVELLKRKCK